MKSRAILRFYKNSADNIIIIHIARAM